MTAVRDEHKDIYRLTDRPVAPADFADSIAYDAGFEVPQIDDTAPDGTIEYFFASCNVTAAVSQVDTKGSAQIRIWAGEGEMLVGLAFQQINLMSQRAISGLVRELTEAHPQVTNWRELIKNVAWRTAKALTPEEAQGEKVQASIIPLPTGCQLKWATDKHTIYAQARRLRSSSDGQVKGELGIRYEVENGKQTTLLVPASFNFSADKTRTEYAKQLAEKTKGAVKVNWGNLFDDLCNRVIDFMREGAPCVEVSLDCEGPPPKQLIEGLVYEGVQNIIYGDKGVNKSTIAYLLGLILSLPWTDNPLELRVPRERKRVLVLDWETNQAIFEYYLARLYRGMKIPICSLHYRRCELPLVDDIEAIQEHVHKMKADVIIIDSLGAAAGGAHGELKGSEAPLLFNKALRSLNCTSLIIGQTAKTNPDGAGTQKTIYGSTYFRYYARNIFELWGDESNHGFDVQHFGLFHRDCNLGKRIDTIGIRIEFDGDQEITVAREAVSVGELKAKLSARAIVLDALKDGAKTVKVLTEITGLARNTVDQTLLRLRAAKPPQVREVAGDTEKGEKSWGLAQDVTRGI